MKGSCRGTCGFTPVQCCRGEMRRAPTARSARRSTHRRCAPPFSAASQSACPRGPGPPGDR
eukprot:7053819-Alexandrium_andersonii.AAC.1